MASEEQLRDYLKWAVADLQRSRARIADLEAVQERNPSASDEPVAIVAMACRYPGGVRTPEQLWRLVADAVDAVGDFPVDRGWDLDRLYEADQDAGTGSYTRHGAFLDAAGEFDAAFFEVSPREALAMDPQQRVLLEVAWEAIERAGIAPASLSGSRTGVFVGSNGQDYKDLFAYADEHLEGQLVTGNSASVVSGRIAYTLGLEGPALSIDTACSSSLVALHVAIESLRRRECDLALAGGVTIMSTPAAFTEFSRQRGLSPDGRCKAFAAAADGTGWGEGAGLLLVERLSDARRNGHDVLAVIRGSAVNQDGASNGLTAPSGPAQQRVILEALEAAGLDIDDVDVVEAHGTGTTLGDPIEAQALLATYGTRDPAAPALWLGSVKSNIGHTQAASGVAGIMKMVLAMQHCTLPRTLHIDEPSPHVDWSAGAVRLLTESTPWPDTGRARRAAVSSFGMSGTNAHVVLEQADAAPSAPSGATAPGRLFATGVPALPWVLTARSVAALQGQAAALRAQLPTEVEAARALASARTCFDHRAVVVTDGTDGPAAGLDALAAGRETPRLVTGPPLAPATRPVFVFPGQGAQWLGMARELLSGSPVFAASMQACAEALAPYLDRPLLDIAMSDDEELLGRVDVVQPLLFAVLVSLAQVWRALGVEPAAVVGHSQGEIAAAHVAGLLSLDDAARVVALRSRALRHITGDGGMVSVSAPVERVEPLLPDGAVVAAVNGPESTIASGSVEVLQELLAACAAAGIPARRVAVDYASHSPAVQAIEAEILEALRDVTPVPGTVPMRSTLTAEWIGDGELGARYWYENLRNPVRLRDAVKALVEQGHRVFVEVGPHPVLLGAVRDTVDDAGVPAAVLGTLRRDHGGPEQLLIAAAQAFVAGVDVDWAAVLGTAAGPAATAAAAALPTYAFERTRFWPRLSSRRGGDPAGLGLRTADHPLLGASVTLAAGDGMLLTGRLSLAAQPWLADHALGGVVVFPGTGLLELAGYAGDQVDCARIEELTLHAPLVVPDEGGVDVQVTVTAAGADGAREVAVHARRTDDTDTWTLHASGVLGDPGRSGATATSERFDWPPSGERVPAAQVYAALDAAGYGYGPAFRGLRTAWRSGAEVFAEVELPEEDTGPAFLLHPALLDAALHPLLLTGSAVEPGLPFSFRGVQVHAAGARTLRVRLRATGDGSAALTAVDAEGLPVVTVEAVTLRPAPLDDLVAAAATTAPLMALEWVPSEPLPAGERAVTVIDQGDLPDAPDVLLLDVPAGPGSVARMHELVRHALDVTQRVLADERCAAATLVVATHGAAGPDVTDPAAAAVWGLLRSAQAEHPDRIVLVDTDTDAEVDAAALVAAGEDQLVLRDGAVLVPRLVRAEDAGAPAWDLEGTVAIVGGTGVLGCLVAEHLARRHGVRRLLLLSRSGISVRAEQLTAELAADDVTVRCRAVDAADRDALAAALAEPDVAPVRAIVQTTGVLDDGVLTDLTAERLDAVLRSKADVAWHLRELARDHDLTQLVLFSAFAGVAGSAGQAPYAAANAAVDAVAAAARAEGLPATSLAWGFWDPASGMTGHLEETDRRRLARQAVLPLGIEQGLAWFDTASGRDAALTVPALLDHGALRRRAAENTLPPLYRRLVPATRRIAATAADEGDRFAGLGPADLRAALLELVRRQAALVLGHDSPATIGTDQAFRELGVDSLLAVELRNRLAAATGVRLPATLVFDHPTPSAVAERLSAEIGDGGPATVRVTAVTRSDDEPIAIVAMACRYPGGVASPEALWQLIADGTDAVAGWPTDRGWDAAALYDPTPGLPGRTSSRDGAFLYDAAAFDAAFFGISPREAVAMDPQQRLLLETSWEAFERAGIDPETMRGTATGVFAGVMYHEYASRMVGTGGADLDEVQGYLGNGSAGSVASGRVSYTLGLEGPAITVDTACSSSLVALHLAAQALRSGECSMALAGGVTVMATPGVFLEFSRQRALAGDGRCKSFADGADGTGWGEGAGMLLVERLSDAQANGHPVLAVVRGSAVNQDGASNGLTAPNGPAQQRVILQALAAAGLSVTDVDAVEGHGTGTTLGDPIEAQALLATYGRDRDPERPLLLGSVKSNIGHTQAAAGVAGIIKMVEAMRRGVLPPTLHVDRPSSHVDWSAGAVELVTQRRDWPVVDRPRRSAVSSFGVSGTNAHVVLEQAPDVAPSPLTSAPTSSAPSEPLLAVPAPWVLSARGETSLPGQAAALLDVVGEVAAGELLHRSVFADRAVALSSAGLAALASGAESPDAVLGRAVGDRVVMVFPGQGSQWAGMARGLVGSCAVFADSIGECEVALAPHVDWSLREVLGGEDEAWLECVDVVQPVLWAVLVSLAAVWRAVGVVPSVVVGHSQGEIAAACVAGWLSVEDAARVVVLRSRAITRIVGAGGMVSVMCSAADVTEHLATCGADAAGVGVAAVNGPESCVVSGPAAGLDTFLVWCAGNGVQARPVAVDYGSHSGEVEPLRGQIVADLAGVGAVTSGDPVPMLSTVTGEWITAGTLDAEYWYANLRNPVRLADAITTLAADGHRLFVEASPHPVLTAAVASNVDGAVALGTLRRDHGQSSDLLKAFAAAWTHGAPVDWTRLVPPAPVSDRLPTYAFDRQRYWLEPQPAAAPAAAGSSALDAEFWAAVEGGDLSGMDGFDGFDGDLDRPVGELLPALADWRRARLDGETVDHWRYRVTWTPVRPGDAAPSGRWLVLHPAGDKTSDTAVDTALTALDGADVTVHEVAAGTTRAQLAALLDGARPEYVLSLFGLDLTPSVDGDAVPAALYLTLALAQGLSDAGLDAPLWSATRGAVGVGRADAGPDPRSAQLWGLGRVIALEHPGVWGGLVDLPAEHDARTTRRLRAVLAGVPIGAPGDTPRDTEDQLAIRGSGLFARRLERAAPAMPTATPWSPHGTVLLTGGTGTLGPHLARWLVAAGADHVVVTGRRGLDAPGARGLAAELGDAVSLVALDVADAAAVTELVDRLEAGGRPVGTVVHAAAAIELTAVADLDAERLRQDLAAKVLGAANLHAAFAGRPLERFVLFSSIAGVWGSGDHAAYAAGNAYLDALAEQRRAAGLPATSIAWGVWAAVNEHAADPLPRGVDSDRLRRQGLPFLDPQLGLTALRQVLDADETFVAVADVDWARFGPAFTSARRRPLLDPILPRAVAVDVVAGPGGSGSDELRSRLAAATPAERDRELVELVRTCAARVLGHGSVDDIDAGRAFRDVGFDSLTAVELRDRLAAATGLSLASTLVFDYPNPAALAAQLRGRLLGEDADAVTVTGTVATADDPIAIVGMSCRFPGGVGSPEQLWQLLVDGRDAVGPFPTDRGWPLTELYDPDPDAPGTSYTRCGGFLDEAGRFDPGFFGISPREAIAMDPQQRLLLTTAWEALERVGVDPTSLRGQPVGVFAGVNGQDYASLLGAAPKGGEGYLATGNSVSVVSGRTAYALGLEGPAVTVDTACSSSLVALHLAAQSVRSGESTLALAGGVTVMSTPAALITFSRQRGLATDGRCKAFADGADGMGMAEGAGVVVLERLSDAQRLGHPVLAVLRGSAINQDGASNGLTAPNGPSQQRVIRAALANAGLRTADVDAVEAHGTGTPLGDPIEVQALQATYGADRPAERPLLVGSIKSNIGHTQAAAGVAGLIKSVLALRHGVLPRTLHATDRSAEIGWEGGGVEVLDAATEWRTDGRPRRIGVSAFGISGTNAHVLLEQAPAAPTPAAAVPPLAGPLPWMVSGRTEAALRAQATRLAAWCDQYPDADPAATARSLAVGRTAFDHRAVVLGDDRSALLAGLHALADATPDRDVVVGSYGSGALGVLFTGQGAQRVGMGAQLYEHFAAYADAFDEVCAHLDAELDLPLRDVVLDGAGDLDDTAYTQPALFAVEVALYRLVESWGVRPEFLAGHSVGELVAAHVGGVLSLRDACRLVAARGRLMSALPAGGAMLAVQAREDELHLPDGVDLAAVNGPSSVVVSGVADAVAALEAQWRDAGRRTRRLTVSHAFHSALMEPMLAEFRAVAESLTYATPTVAIVSNVTGALAASEVTTADYWVRHVRAAVRFADGVGALLDAGATTLLELGPDAVLTAMAGETLVERPARKGRTTAAVVPSLRRDRDEVRSLTQAVAAMFVRGVPVDRDAWLAGVPALDDPLPTYAFQDEQFWLTASPAPLAVAAADAHPLLGAATAVADATDTLFTTQLSLTSHPWLAGHRILDTVLVPGTAFAECALHAGRQVGAPALTELTLESPLALPAEGAVTLQLRVVTDGDGCAFTVHSRADGGTPWVRHASGSLAASGSDVVTDWAQQWPPAGARPIDVAEHYESLAARGYDYGAPFQGLRAAWRRDGELFAEVALPDDVPSAQFGVHPALLDAALHVLGIDGLDVPTGVPFAWSDVTLAAAGAREVRVRLVPSGAGVAVDVADNAGGPVLSIGSLVLREVSAAQVRAAGAGSADGVGLFGLEWLPLEASGTPAPPRCVLLGDGVAGLREHVEVADADADLVVTGVTGPEQALAAVQDWLRRDDDTRLIAVTGADPLAPGAAGTWGLLRAAVAELPGQVSIIGHDGRSWDLVAGVLGHTTEPQLLVRGGRVEVARLGAASVVPALPEGDWRVVVGGGGTLDAVAVRADVEGGLSVERAGVGGGLGVREVRVRVRVAGVNFRDVLMGLGMYPGGDGVVGSEVAGVVEAVGSEVRRVGVGDRVFGMVPGGGFGTVVTTDERGVARIPSGWSFAQAGSSALVFLTALYALQDRAGADGAGVGVGERVLVHSAAGGVGMAAVQVARWLGAEVFGTASPGKWGVLRGLGLDEGHVASSRDTSFVQRFGRVDTVLNSLAGEFVDASLGLLGDGGWLLEMGKTDVRDAGSVGAGVNYRAFDLVEAGPDRIAELLDQLCGLAVEGAVVPLPVRCWDVRAAGEALRFVAQARHVGKVALTIPQPVDLERPVVITGGTGGLGRVVARHLAGRGFTRIAVLSRTAGTADLSELGELGELGDGVFLVSVDVTDRGGLAAALEAVRTHWQQPIGAVVHAAGIVEDALVADWTPEQLRRVGAVKDGAARHLHELTAADEPAAFVLFSSVSGMLGSAGQAGYAAANAELDALAVERAAAGLPATSLAWGPWSAEAGMTANLSAADLARMTRGGMPPLQPGQALALLDQALTRPEAVLAPLHLDRRALAALRRDAQLPPVFERLVGTPSMLPTARTATAPDALDPGTRQRDELLALSGEQRREQLIEIVQGETALVLGLGSPELVELERGFLEMGVDSLAAVELRNRLGALVGHKLPTTIIFDYPNPLILAGFLDAELGEPDARRPDPSTPSAAASAPEPAPEAVRAPDLDDELDRIEQLLVGTACLDGDDERIATRLRRLLPVWQTRADRTPPPAPSPEPEVAPDLNGHKDDIATATAAELFAMLDQELGS